MSHKTMGRSLVAAVLLSALSPALARASTQPAPPLTISFGGFTMTNANAQSGGSDATGLATVGADYAFIDAGNTRSAVASAYVDALGLGGTQTDRILGAGVAIRTTGPAYAGAGIGYYSVTIAPPAACAASGRGPAGLGGAVPGCYAPAYTGSGVGGKLFAGLSFSRSVRIQVDYVVLPPAGRTSSNAFGANLGIRI